MNPLLSESAAVTIAPESARSPDAAHLIAQLTAELAATYHSDGSAGFVPADVEQPGSAFLVARCDGVAIGCVALRPYEPGIGEVKRMFVAPEWRGRKVGGKLLRTVEAAARDCGYTRLLLETATRQANAIALYERYRYTHIPAFGRYIGDPYSVCFAKDLI